MTQKRWISRKNFMDIAKIVRNHGGSNGPILAKKLADYLEPLLITFDRKIFMQVATGKIEGDPRTEYCSLLKGDSDESH